MAAPSRKPGHIRASRQVRVRTLSSLNAPRVSGGGGGDTYLRQAADIVAATARATAGWSAKIPPSIYVTVAGNIATVHAGAPDARPAEFRLSHPLFGNREHWYGPPGTRFLAPALDASAEKAMAKYAGKIDAYARDHGWS